MTRPVPSASVERSGSNPLRSISPFNQAVSGAPNRIRTYTPDTRVVKTIDDRPHVWHDRPYGLGRSTCGGAGARSSWPSHRADGSAVRLCADDVQCVGG